MPLATLIAWHAVHGIGEELLESASLDGANRWQLLTRVTLPMRKRAVAVTWVVALAVALGELSASLLVAPPGVSTLSITLFGLIHYGVDDRVAGISLCVFAIVFVLGFALSTLTQTKRDGAARLPPSQATERS